MCDAPIGTIRWSPAKIEMVSKNLMYSVDRAGIVTDTELKKETGQFFLHRYLLLWSYFYERKH